jgi:hypothetical protein
VADIGQVFPVTSTGDRRRLRRQEVTTMEPDVRHPHEGVRYATYDSVVAQFEREVIRRVNRDLSGQDSARVHAELVRNLRARLPGIDFDERNLWTIAGAIASRSLPEQVW